VPSKRSKGKGEPQRGGNRNVASNRKAFHDYTIDDRLEAGLVLRGSEIKSIRAGKVNLRDSYVAFRGNEAWLVGAHIAGYNQASYLDHEPLRDRKLLLHRREILKWRARVEQRGLTVVPLRLYLKDNRAKVEIGLAQGKRLYDKRQAISKRETDRSLRRAMKEAGR